MRNSNEFRGYLGDKEPFNMAGRQVTNLQDLLEGLKAIDKKQYEQYNNAAKNDFYNWIFHCVGDKRLARDIMKIRIKENMIKIVEARITQLKDFVRHPGNSAIEKRVDMYVDHVQFLIDNEVCSNCEVCTLVCPKEAVEIKDGKKTVSDDCTKCGFCVHFCPVECISLNYNNEKHDFYTEHEMIPKLPGVEWVNNQKARKLFRGSYEVKDKCPPGCELCVQACPINIITRFKGNKQLPKIEVDRDLCLMCGACKNACPYDLIESHRVSIIHEGKEYCNAWNRAIEKLCRVELKNIYHNDKNLGKFRELIDKSGLRKY